MNAAPPGTMVIVKRLFLVASLLSACCLIATAQDNPLALYQHPAIRYATTPATDAVAKLNARLQSGAAALSFAPRGGYLKSVLDLLHVSTDSQIVVFSKTSLQSDLIAPKNPRAIYFSDDVSVGYVRGSNLLEVAALDPRQGVIFYSFDQEADPPRFDRRDVCLQCHESKGTLGIPGLMVASVYPDADGMPAFMGAQMLTDHRSRFEGRWGGWYVTGTHGDMRHLGNAVGHERDHPEVLDTRGTLNLTSLAKKFDPTGYLSLSSDIVALMTLEHQTRMTDLMIRVGWEARVAEHDGKSDNAARARFESDVDSLVAYMLFADETQLNAKVEGTSSFAQTFAARGPRDSKGRSLRDFDLRSRLFRYPLSYMIYSDAFEAMPESVRARVYQRLHDILKGEDRSAKFQRLSDDDRSAILEILRDTKPGLPAYWKSPS